MIQIQHLRHASMLFTMSGKKIFIDPYLAEQGSLPPIPFTSLRLNNPLLPLPVKMDELKDIDAILLTHYHLDHFDEAAKKNLSKNTLIFCQPKDEKKLKRDGFHTIKVIDASVEWQGLTISRFEAKHGFGLLSKILGKSSSYTIKSSCGLVFFTGDTIYNEMFVNNLKTVKPDIVIANAGSAKLIFGKPITLRNLDIEKIAKLLPESKVIVVHMDAINHCQQSRADLKEYILKKDYAQRVLIPQNGELLTFK